jgi:hypothetical protein
MDLLKERKIDLLYAGVWFAKSLNRKLFPAPGPALIRRLD